MIFHSCCFIDHLHCCLSSRVHRIHSLIHHLFIRAHLPRTTLLPSYPRNLTRTHLQIHPSRISSKSTFIPTSPLSSLLFSLSLTHYFAGILILCPNPTILRSTSTLAGSFLFFYQQYSISAYYASAWLLGNVSRHHVFLGLPAASAVGCIGKNSKS